MSEKQIDFAGLKYKLFDLRLFPLGQIRPQKVRDNLRQVKLKVTP